MSPSLTLRNGKVSSLASGKGTAFANLLSLTCRLNGRADLDWEIVFVQDTNVEFEIEFHNFWKRWELWRAMGRTDLECCKWRLVIEWMVRDSALGRVDPSWST